MQVRKINIHQGMSEKVCLEKQRLNIFLSIPIKAHVKVRNPILQFKKKMYKTFFIILYNKNLLLFMDFFLKVLILFYFFCKEYQQSWDFPSWD